MNPVKEEELTPASGGALVVYAKDQPEYLPLPTMKFTDGKVYSEWVPNEEERAAIEMAILENRPFKVRLWQWTFNQPLQPVALEIV